MVATCGPGEKYVIVVLSTTVTSVVMFKSRMSQRQLPEVDAEVVDVTVNELTPVTVTVNLFAVADPDVNSR